MVRSGMRGARGLARNFLNTGVGRLACHLTFPVSGARLALLVLAAIALTSFTGIAAAQTPSMFDDPETQVSGGLSHTCALSALGRVRCWGDNANGQLGNGSTTDRLTPADVTGFASGAAAISAGARHTCAVTTTGGVKCWGDNLRGQIGDNSTTNRLTPVDVSGLSSGVAAISAGGAHTCVLTSAGGVKCWGNNDDGQVGDNSGVSRLTPVDVTGLATGVAAISAGRVHTCALMSAGGVKCWGYNFYGQIGDNTMSSRFTPVDVSGVSTGVVAISSGADHSCALTSAGGVKCWGFNLDGELGDNSTTIRLIPVNVSGLASGVMSISAAYAHTCALTNAGGVKCWGSNGYGQLGDGSSTPRLTPVDVTSLGSGVAALAAGYDQSCALTTTGGLKCWGRNDFGQIGDNSTINRSTAVEVVGLSSRTISIRSGQNHSCALTSAGGVKCWGYNGNGQIGDDTTINRLSPVAVVNARAGVAAISVGRTHSCLVTKTGGAQCWGLNVAGQLGNGTTTDGLRPEFVNGLNTGVVAVATGWFHACALTTLGGVKCWGSNSGGQLGDGTTTQRLTPVDVVGLTSGVRAITAGSGHTCAETTADGLKCWGSNTAGQLGDGTITSRSTPVDVSGLGATSGAMKVSAGWLHTCALYRGAAKCWGANGAGQLGDNTTTARLTPITVGNPLGGGVTAISAGDQHSCAVDIFGGTWCWGLNSNGQIGDTTTDPRLSPVGVTGLNVNVVAVSNESASHTCALTTEGGVRCWGSSTTGEIGDSATTDRWTPVVIRSGQSISFSPPTTVTGAGTLGLTASATSGRPVTFDTWTPTTCSITGSTLNFTGTEGSVCGVRASQAGVAPLPAGGSIAPAPQQLRLIRRAAAASSSTSLSSSLNPSTYATAVTLTAQVTGSAGPLPTGTIDFFEGATALGTIPLNGSGNSSASFSTLSVGSHSFTAVYSGDANYPSSMGALTQVVNKANQVIVFNAAPNVSVGGTGTVSATGGNSGNSVTFTSTTTAICTISGATVAGLAVGTCSITANQLGNGNYNAAAPQTQSFSITSALPILDIDSSGSTTKYDAATDGVLLIRYLLGYRNNALTSGAISGTAQRDATQIAAHIAANLTRFDVDGDGLTLALTDGVMILRRLLGITSPAAITQGVKNSARSDTDVVLAIDALKP